MGGETDQCCKVYQMHVIVTTVTAIALFFVLFYTTTVSYLGSGCRNVYLKCLSFFFFFMYEIMPFVVFFCNILFPVGAIARCHRGAVSSLLLEDSVG